eukprot:gene5712-7107_t
MSNKNTKPFVSPAKKSSSTTPTKTTTTTTKLTSKFTTPTKKSTNTTTETETPTNTTPKKKKFAFQTPTKENAQNIQNTPKTPLIKNNNHINNSTTNTTNNSNNKTKNKNNNIEDSLKIFSSKPIINLKDFTNITDDAAELPNRIVEFLYNSKDQPHTLKEIIKHLNHDDSSIVQKIVDKLVDNHMIKEITLEEGDNTKKRLEIKIYSSMTWFKLVEYVYNQRVLIHQEELERKEQEDLVKKNSSTTTTTTATSKIKPVNHLSTSTPKKGLKRKSTLGGTSISSDPSISTTSSFSSPLKKLKAEDSKSFERDLDKELIHLDAEKKRIQKSIQDKKELLAKFKSKSLSPISEQKKTNSATGNTGGEVDHLITKWKRVARDAIDMLQIKVQEMFKKQEEEGLNPSSSGPLQQSNSNQKLVGFRSSNNWNSFDTDSTSNYNNNNQDGDEDDQEEISEYDERYQDQSNKPEDILKGVDPKSKLYIIKSFGFDAELLGYDEDNDVFLK